MGLVVEVLRELPDDRARRAYLGTLRRWAGHAGTVPPVGVLDALALRADPAELARLVSLFRELGPGRAVRVEAAAALLRMRVDRSAAAERLRHRFGVSRATAYRDLARALDARGLAHLSHPAASRATWPSDHQAHPNEPDHHHAPAIRHA